MNKPIMLIESSGAEIWHKRFETIDDARKEMKRRYDSLLNGYDEDDLYELIDTETTYIADNDALVDFIEDDSNSFRIIDLRDEDTDDKKHLLISTDGYDITVTEFKNYESAFAAMKEFYENQNSNKNIPDAFKEMSEINEYNARCYTGDNVFLWSIHIDE